MTTIYKYAIEGAGRQTIIMPIGAQVLCVQSQKGDPYIWALVDPAKQPTKRLFELFGTGHDVADDMGTERKYIGTFQLNNGGLVFHLFEYTGV